MKKPNNPAQPTVGTPHYQLHGKNAGHNKTFTQNKTRGTPDYGS